MKIHWKLITPFLLMACVSVLPAQTAAPKEDMVEGNVGQNIIIPVETPDSASIDRRDIVTYLDPVPEGEDRLILTALKAGIAHVTVVKNNQTTVYTVAITDPNESDKAKLIKEMVGQPGLEVLFVNNGSVIVLQGEVEDDIYMRKAINLANAYTPSVLNYVSVKRPLQVRIKVQVVSVEVTHDSDIGMQYGPQNASGTGLAIPFGFNASGSKFPFFSTTNLSGNFDVTATLNLAQQDGKVKILQEPTLTVLNGQASVFRVGGEFPVLSRTFDDNGNTTITATYRPFGISLLVTPLVEETQGLSPAFAGGSDSNAAQPIQTFGMRESPNLPMTVNSTIDRNGIIKMFVRPEISSLDYSRVDVDPVNNPFPNIDERLVETRVAMKNRESLIIGGLFDENLQESMQRVPFISKVPILGEFFKNRTKNSDRRELVFILTPEIIGREIMQAGDKPQPRLSEMADQLKHANETLPVNPVKISAAEVMIRTADYTPAEGGAPASQATSKKVPLISPSTPAANKSTKATSTDNGSAVPLSSSVGELPRKD